MYGRAATPLAGPHGSALPCPAVPPIPPRAPRVQLSILGKVRQVLLPDIFNRSLLSLRGGAGANDPVFTCRKGAT